MQILLVEDNQHKRVHISSFLSSIYPNVEVREAYSFTSGCQALADGSYPVVILDMSLPTYDKTGTEAGGRFRTFGGREIARKIVRSKSDAKIVFVTQYDAFSDKGGSHSLQTLTQELIGDCGENFGGVIFFDSSQSAWKNELMNFLNPILNENTNS